MSGLRSVLGRIRGYRLSRERQVARIGDDLRAVLARKWNKALPLTVRVDSEARLAPRIVELARDGTRFVVTLPAEGPGPGTDGSGWRRIVAFLLQFERAEGADRMTVMVGDGQFPGTHRFSPSPFLPQVVAIPDPYLFRFHGYRAADAQYAAAPDWDDREDRLVWRGAPNGVGTFGWDPALLDIPTLMQRNRMVLTCRGSAIDAGFVFPQHHPLRGYEGAARAGGIMADPIPSERWAGMRYALDIDGHSTTWNNFPVRLKQGCCVLKVDSQVGFRQWYYPRLRPWEHYVPVRADLGDLIEVHDWLRTNPARAREIAAAGRAEAARITLEREWAEGARLIAEHWDG